jgi:hypothetical protein
MPDHARRVVYNEKAAKDKSELYEVFAYSNKQKRCNGTEMEHVHKGFKEARCQTAVTDHLVDGRTSSTLAQDSRATTLQSVKQCVNT